MTTAFMAWEVMGSIDWIAVTAEPVAKLLSFSRGEAPSPSLLLKLQLD